VRRLLLPVLLLATSGCALGAETATPTCEDVERVALVAQSVPSAAYVPCLTRLPTGWRAGGFDVERGSSTLTLRSDRGGGRPVEVVLTEGCDVRGASPAPPRAVGVRSYLRVDSVSPEYAGTAYDVFPGGCVRAEFAFPRGPHIPLMEDLGNAVELVPRREVRIALRNELGVELDR
jgi:hypothetical protein